ncbi:MAG: hypothetical protein ACXVZI_10100 [Terriglobales bacterium]
MRLAIRDWLLKQMNARDSLDGITVTVKLSVTEFGPKRVARELRSMAASLDRRGMLPGWNFDGTTLETADDKPGRRGNAA